MQKKKEIIDMGESLSSPITRLHLGFLAA